MTYFGSKALLEHCVFGHQDATHFLSSETAAGDELGWNYLNLVTNSQATLTCFQAITDKKHKGLVSSVSFGSRRTKTEWLFSWMCDFGIDFQQECVICGENPKVLAGDGITMDVLFRNVSFQPIESPATQETNDVPDYKRTDRQFFSYKKECPSHIKLEKRMAREDLNYLIHKNTNRLKEYQNRKVTKTSKDYSDRSETDRKSNVLKHSPEACHEILQHFMSGDITPSTVARLVTVLEVCVTEKPVSSLINFRFTKTCEM